MRKKENICSVIASPHESHDGRSVHTMNTVEFLFFFVKKSICSIIEQTLPPNPIVFLLKYLIGFVRV